MTEETRHYQLEIQDLLDDRLDSESRAKVEAHIRECSKCRSEFEALQWTKRRARALSPAPPTPEELRSKIAHALDDADKDLNSNVRSFRWQPLMVSAAAVLVIGLVVGLVFRVTRPLDFPSLIAADYQRYTDGKLAIQKRTTNVQEMERFFRQSGIEFETRVFDLAMMQYTLVGGSAHRLNGRQSALFIYQKKDEVPLVCQMFPASLEELPPKPEIRKNKGIDFFIYHRNSRTIVFWQEGKIMCALISQAPSEEVVQLAFAKAVKI